MIFNPVSEILFSCHLRRYRLTAPTHGGGDRQLRESFLTFPLSHFKIARVCALEAVRIGALCWRGTFASTGDGLLVQDLASGARPKDDALRLADC